MSAAEVTVIRLWIAAGASGALPVAAIKGAPPPVRKIEFPQIDAAAIARARAPLAQIVEELRTRLPGALTYESRGSADLHLNAALLGRAFGDAEVAALAPIRERIVWADLSGTAISDASAPALAEFTRLRTLRVANTDIADPTARTLTALESLTSLTVTGTAVTASGLAALRRRGVKIHDGHAKASNAI